jgi:hypothetical protein
MRVRPYRNRSKTGRVRVADLDGNLHTVLDETGKVFGELFVVRLLRIHRNGGAMFLCVCSCHQHCEVAGSALRAAANNTFSCGHIRRELASQRGEAAPGFKHGHSTIAALATSTYWKTYYKQVLAAKKNQVAVVAA